MILPRTRVATVWAVQLSILAAIAQPLTLAASRPEPPGVQQSTGIGDERAMSDRVARTGMPGRATRLQVPAAVTDSGQPSSVAGAPHAIEGVATWYAAAPGAAAAGPALRRALGRDWRGTWVVVRHTNEDGFTFSVTVNLSDWCACGRRGGVPTVIDLSDDAFRALAPLSVGVISVTVSPVIPPATDTAP